MKRDLFKRQISFFKKGRNIYIFGDTYIHIIKGVPPKMSFSGFLALTDLFVGFEPRLMG